MKRFENYWAEEVRWEAEQEIRQREKRRRTREQRRAQVRHRLTLMAAVLLCTLAAVLAATVFAKSARADDRPQLESEPAETLTQPIDEPVQEDYENEKIEAALVETGYFRDDIPLDFDTQACLRAACEESGVPFELALAVIRQETNYQNVDGDSGNSIGYMQVQPRWHQERMDRLGVTDLSNPYGNFRVGCDYLADLMRKYTVEEALTAYNSGRPGESAYADQVREFWRELRE